MATPKKNTAYAFDVVLIDATSRPNFKSTPTIAAGDFKVSTDEGAFANLATLPVVSPAAGIQVKISLSAAEMNGDRIGISCIDQTNPKEWDDLYIYLDTTSVTVDDLVRSTTPANTLTVDASGLINITQAAADKVWLSATRTLTAFSTALALSVWDVLESAILIASSIGLKLKNNLDAAITSRQPSGNVTVGGYAAGQTPADSVLITPANKLSTDVSGLVNITQAAADKVFGSGASTLAELPQGIPPATPRPDQAIMLGYMSRRNLLQVTATEKRITNDAGTVIAKKTLSDDLITYAEAEMVSGP